MIDRSLPTARRTGTVLVAGASGKLGQHVVREFRRRGWRVRALTRDPRKLLPIADHVDEVAPASLSKPDSLTGICDGVDVVFSAAGASVTLGALRDRHSFMEVDFAGNANLLEQARIAGVSRFVYVSLFGARQLVRTEYAGAHERFVASLASSQVPYTVVRPTGFFSVFGEFVTMAARGPALLVGDGATHTNPVDERDLATVCVDAVDEDEREISVGGPKVYTRRRIAELAFEALGKPARIVAVPPWAMRGMSSLLYPVNPRLHALMSFGIEASALDLVAPPRGSRTLPDYFAELALARRAAPSARQVTNSA